MKEDIVQKAKELAYTMHQDQKRKDGLPYITHPKGVVKILAGEGIIDETIISVAWLHDVLEDTPIEYESLEKQFGKNIAEKVYILSRNIDREEYKLRIKNSDYAVKIIKLADTLHNIHDAYSLSYLPQTSIQRKIDDCMSFYIPMAVEVSSTICCKIIESIDNYLRFSGGMKK